METFANHLVYIAQDWDRAEDRQEVNEITGEAGIDLTSAGKQKPFATQSKDVTMD